MIILLSDYIQEMEIGFTGLNLLLKRGEGFMTSSLKCGDDASAGTGGAIIKGGAKIYLGYGIHLRLEYKQTLPKDSNKLFYACSVGLGIRM